MRNRENNLELPVKYFTCKGIELLNIHPIWYFLRIKYSNLLLVSIVCIRFQRNTALMQPRTRINVDRLLLWILLVWLLHNGGGGAALKVHCAALVWTHFADVITNTDDHYGENGHNQNENNSENRCSGRAECDEIHCW